MTAENSDRLTSDLLAHQRFLRRVARELVGESAADDLVQDTWVAALEHPPARLASPRAWLRAVLRNKSVDRHARELRNQEHEQQVARGQSDTRGAELEERLELVRRVADALRDLPEPFRRVVYLATYEDRGPSAIARELGVPLETVRSRLRRGRALLRESLDREYGGRRGAWSAILLPFAAPRALPLAPAGAAPSLPPLLGALAMGSKSALAIAAVVALSVTLLLWQPWEPAGLTAAGASLEEESISPLAVVEGTVAPIDTVIDRGEPDSVERTPLVAAPIAVDGQLAVSASFGSDGRPAAGVNAHLSFDDVDEPAFVLDDRGAYSVASLAPGTWFVHLHGYGRWRAEIVAGESTDLVLEIPTGLIVSGAVLDHTDQPVAGAEIFLSREGDVPGQWVVTTTDGAGRFEIRDLAPWRSSGPFTELAARARGFATSRAWVAMGTAGDRPHVIFRLLGVAGSLSGRVIDREGSPVPGAELELRTFHSRIVTQDAVNPEGVTFEEPPHLRVVTDGRGEFACHTIPPGLLEIRTHTGQHPEQINALTIEAHVPQTIEIVLGAGGILRGRVLDARGQAIVGASLSALGMGDRSYRHVSAGADGRFRIEGLPSGTCELTARAPDGSQVSATPMIVSDATTEEDLVIAAADSLAGLLVDEAGAPLVGYGVHMTKPPRDGLWYRSSRTDAEGRFLLEGLPDGPKALEVRLPSAFSAPPLLIAPWPEDDSQVRLVVPASALPSATLEGAILHGADTRIENVTLALQALDYNWGQQGFTDRDTGRFRFGPLVPGSYRLRFEAPGHVEQTVEILDLAIDETRDIGRHLLTPGGVLEVHVPPREARAPAPDLWVLSAETGERHELAYDGAGSATSKLLAPGQYELHVAGRATRFQTTPTHVAGGEVTVLELALEPGASRRLRLTPAPGEGSAVRVDVFDASGQPFRGPARCWGDVVIIEGLGAGEWRVVVSTDDGLWGETRLVIDSFGFQYDAIPLALE